MTKQYRPSMFISANRDKNESKITDVLKNFHVDYYLLSPGAGADILVETSPMQLWEVKNPDTKWKLSEAELSRKTYCAILDIPYHVVETAEQAIEILRKRE